MYEHYPDYRKQSPNLFCYSYPIAGIKCVNRGKRITGIQVDLIDAVVVVFAAIRVFGIEILADSPLAE